MRGSWETGARSEVVLYEPITIDPNRMSGLPCIRGAGHGERGLGTAYCWADHLSAATSSPNSALKVPASRPRSIRSCRLQR